MTSPSDYDETSSVWMGPRYAMWRGTRFRVLSYDHDGLFWCLGPGDERRLLHRDVLTFTKPRKKA